MQIVECEFCQLAKACSKKGSHYLSVIQASLTCVDAADCAQFQPNYLRGIEGVYLSNATRLKS